MADEDKTPDASEADAPASPPAPKAFGPDDCPKCEECPPCVKGAPAWMATFADMATLLMAFFVLLLSFAEMNVPKYKQINGSLKNSFGVQRLIPVVESPKAQSIIARHFSPSVAEPTPINTIRQQTTDDRKEEVEVKTDVAPEAQQALEAAKQAMAQEISKGEVEVKLENGKVVVQMNDTPTGGGGAGKSGSQQAGAGNSGAASAGASASGSQSGGAAAGQASGGAASGAQAGGSSPSGAQAGASGPSGQQQGGKVTQGEIEFFAKVADVQAQAEVPVEVRDARGQNKAGGAAGQGGSAAETDAEFARIRKELAKEIEKGKAEVERDGAKIIIRLAEQGSFGSGSADLQAGFTDVLGQVGKTIAPTTGRVFVEGHTDNVPVVFNDRFRSNWDLSGARAGAVADFLTGSAGVPPGRMSVSGYADTRPLESNNEAVGRARNRRIEIIIDGGG